MRTNSIKNFSFSKTFIPAVACLAALAFAGTPNVRAADMPSDSQQVSQLLSDAKTQAFQLKEDVWKLESFGRVNVTATAHAKALRDVTDHVNELGETLIAMQMNLAQAAPWQRQAVEHISPWIEELTATTSGTIDYLNENQNRAKSDVPSPEYDAYLDVNARLATSLSNLIGDFVDYQNERQRFDVIVVTTFESDDE